MISCAIKARWLVCFVLAVWPARSWPRLAVRLETIGQAPLPLFAERQDQKLAERQFLFVAISRHPDGDFILRNVAAKRAMEFISPAKDSAPVGVGLALHDGVMNSVHARSYDDQVQDALEPDGQSPVRMMKKCCYFEAQEKNQQHDRRDPESHDGQREESNGKNHFAEMKSCRSAHIEVEVGVVHIVKPPKERDHMVGPMPPPICVIHEQKGRDPGGQSWQTQPGQ
jgi:hypothetical protein